MSYNKFIWHKILRNVTHDAVTDDCRLRYTRVEISYRMFLWQLAKRADQIVGICLPDARKTIEKPGIVSQQNSIV